MMWLVFEVYSDTDSICTAASASGAWIFVMGGLWYFRFSVAFAGLSEVVKWIELPHDCGSLW